MTPLAASILGGIVCGITMVAGGIALLYKGAINLEVASKDPALTVDLFQHEFSMTTRVPALGLFTIGLLFVGASMYVAMKTDVQRIPVLGEIEGVDQPLTVTAHTQWSVTASQHEVNDVLRPSLDVLWIRIEAPGYRPVERPFARDSMAGKITLGKVHLDRVAAKIEPKDTNIAPIGFQAPNFDPRSGGFQIR